MIRFWLSQYIAEIIFIVGFLAILFVVCMIAALIELRLKKKKEREKKQ